MIKQSIEEQQDLERVQAGDIFLISISCMIGGTLRMLEDEGKDSREWLASLFRVLGRREGLKINVTRNDNK